MYIAPGQGQTTPQGLKFSININLLSNLPIPSTFYPLSAGSHKNHAKLKIHSTSSITDFDEIYFI